ncbi:MAG TPA: hypothetical protein VFB16_08465 [Bauldia sp.]|nr:hypothetical protein [Bauldia sp.]
MPRLILTNGDTAADLLVAAGRAGRIQPWRDVLHEGPIAFDLAAAMKLRVPWLARRMRIDATEVAAAFADRDALVQAHDRFDEIELWFEHDLYDQLQLLQILAFFADAGRSEGLTLIQADDFLGAQTPDTILSFATAARPVDGHDLDLAERVWADLAMPTPERAFAFLASEADPRLPYVEPALRRFFEELPAPGTGLSRTEFAALTAIASGATDPFRLFGAVTMTEPAAFMGDASFFAMLDDLAVSAVPLVAGIAPPGAPEDEMRRHEAASLTLTEAGRAVLAGGADHIALNGIDRWWAGTHQAGRAVWRYDRHAVELVPPPSPGA